MAVYESGIHQDLNVVSALLLFTIGFVVFLRARNFRINQLLALFFFGLATFELFDGFTIAFRADPSISFLNTLRDVAVIGLILSLSFAVLATFTIYYGEETVFRLTRLIPFYLGVGVVIAIGLIGDSIPESTWHADHAHFHTDVTRNILGLGAIFGLILVFSGITLFTVVNIIRTTEGDVKSKLLRFLIGLGIMLFVILFFDLSAFVDPITDLIITSNEFHILLHVLLFIGELFILSSFWTSLQSGASSGSASPSG